ncbi:MAG: TonB-dependent receptor [Bacteroidota bacterium]
MRLNLVIFFLLLTLSGFSQNVLDVNYSNTPLKVVVSDIESKTQLLFSYKETVIINKKVTLKANQMALEDLLKRIEKQCKVRFQYVSDKQIIIKPLDTQITICGYIFDASTNTPLSYADIIILDKPKIAVSDNDGYFEINDVLTTDIVRIQYLGYRTQEYQAKTLINTSCKNVFLSEDSELLNDVIINAYITSGLDKSNDGSTTITNSEIGVLPGQSEQDVFQSLATIPGITSLNESVSDIQIRGGNKDQNLILFDDIKLYNTGHFFGMLSAINPHIIESTKVYKGGASPEYGDRISGIIDLSTTRAIPDSTQFGFGINGTHLDGFIKAPLSDKVGVLFSLRRSYVDVVTTPTFNAFSEKVFENTSLFIDEDGSIEDENDEGSETDSDNTFYFFDTNMKLTFRPSSKDYIGISGLLTTNNVDFLSTFEEDNILDQLDIENRGISAVWVHNHEKLSYATKAYFSSFESAYNNSFSNEGITEEQNNRLNKVEDFGFSFNLSYSFSKKHKAKIGYQFSNNDVFFNLSRQITDDDIEDDERNFNSTAQNSNTTHTVFGEYVFKPKENSFMSFGLRTSRYSVFNDFYIAPRLNIEYPIFNFLRLKATAERRYQVISELVQFEDTQVRLENQVWTLSGIDDIPLLSSTQFSGGVILNIDDFIVDIDAYTKQIKGLTSFTNGFTNATQDFSEGESDIFGIDVLVKKSFDRLNLWAGYTFNDINYTFNEIQSTSFRGNNDITNNFRLSASYDLKKWQFSLGWNYRTGSPFTPVESFDTDNDDINFGPINSQRLPDYHRLDASLVHKFELSKNDKVTGIFSISLQNIYARQVPLSVFYRADTNPSTATEELNRIEQLSLGFTPNATLRVNF